MERPTATRPADTAEHRRLLEQRRGEADWRKWGPYLSERAWATVREDYSPDGDAWNHFPHDHARSRVFRWGEDGLAGYCDDHQFLCFSVALWNGRDAILKERLFGLTGPQGNHGEDVKELYYYLDATPTHSYLKFLYKYPQNPFPYERLERENAARGEEDPEFELTDTGVFDGGRYFDVFVEYARATPTRTLVRITAVNRGPDEAALHVLPQLWFRNTWAWGLHDDPRPKLTIAAADKGRARLRAEHPRLGEWWMTARGDVETLLTDNETNAARLWPGATNTSRYVKDAFHRFIVEGEESAVNPDREGTKAAWHFSHSLKPGESASIDMVLDNEPAEDDLADFAEVLERRKAEADAFYDAIHRPQLTEDERILQRQALAGMIWTKQYYEFDVHRWLEGDPAQPPPAAARKGGRNHEWTFLSVSDVISMPDKWEYPWFAAWDWAFHAVPLAMVDIDLAKSQLELITSEKLLHPNGQIPAYEWAFSDVNPPVQAWAVWRVYNMEKHANKERGDLDFLMRCYHKLLLNFISWVNRKDSAGHNIFEGGFLGLDNISVFDRSQPLPDGRRLEQADATGWMALYSLNMMAIGLELAQHDRNYEHLAIKFFEHFLVIARALNGEITPGLTMWNQEEGWYYDVVRGSDDVAEDGFQLRVRSQVGMIPLLAAMVLRHSWFEKLPNFKRRYEWLLSNRPDLGGAMGCRWTDDGQVCLLSVASIDKVQRVLGHVLDEKEFLSPYGVRSMSKHHESQPFSMTCNGEHWDVRYEPGESRTGLFGGNSNWRGPIWFPTNFLLITALRVYDRFFGDSMTIECPAGSGNKLTLNQAAMQIARRLSLLFLPDSQGKRPMHGRCALHNDDPHFRDHLLFHEYFHAETGKGLGASHQTGWTGLIAKLLDQLAREGG